MKKSTTQKQSGAEKLGPITFDLSPRQMKALEDLSGGCRVVLSGQVVEGKLVINSFTLQSSDPKSAYTAVNAPFSLVDAG